MASRIDPPSSSLLPVFSSSPSYFIQIKRMAVVVEDGILILILILTLKIKITTMFKKQVSSDDR